MVKNTKNIIQIFYCLNVCKGQSCSYVVCSPGNESWPDPNPSSALFLWAGADPDPIWALLFIILIQFGPFYLKSYSYS